MAAAAGVLLWASVHHMAWPPNDRGFESRPKEWNGDEAFVEGVEPLPNEELPESPSSEFPPPKIAVRKRSYAGLVGTGPYPGIDERLRTEALSVHDSEPRDERWAPAMEAAFGRRLTTEELEKYGLTDLQITELSCRRVTCRLAYEYPASVEDLLAANGLPRDTSPLALIEEQTGPPAPLNLGWRRDQFDRDGQRLVRMVAVFAFDEDSYDPGRYDEWVESQIERAREAFGLMPRRWFPPEQPALTNPLDAG